MKAQCEIHQGCYWAVWTPDALEKQSIVILHGIN